MIKYIKILIALVFLSQVNAQENAAFFENILLSADSVTVDLYVDYTNEMAVDKNHIIRKKFKTVGLDNKDANRFIKVMNNPNSFVNYYANYSHKNLVFTLHENKKNIGEIIISSVSGNATFKDLKGNEYTRVVKQTTGQYIIRLLKVTDLLQYFYPSNLVGFSRGKDNTIEF